MIDGHSLEVLRELLASARQRGFLGPVPVEPHIQRSLDFLEGLPAAARVAAGAKAGPRSRAAGIAGAAGVAEAAGVAGAPGVLEMAVNAVDLGSGGGIPGLVLALALPRSRWTLLEASQKRSAFLTEAVGRLSLDRRVSVVAERAEIAGRGPMRGSFDLVVARSFAAPAVTAECAAPLLHVGGLLIVAEPPADDGRAEGAEPAIGGRWPAEPLATLGLAPVTRIAHPSALQVLEQLAPCPARYPRRVGIPSKRPLF